MRETMPETPNENGRNRALNGDENASRPLIEDEQLVLGSSEEKCRVGASRMATFAHHAMRDNGFSGSTVGSLAGKDAVAAHRAFDPEEPPTALLCLAALLLLDKNRTWLRGAARLVGCELVERPTLTDAEFRRRVETKAKHGKADAAWLEEALEEKP